MKRIMLTVAYDGTNYCGWQKQPNGITIEEVLDTALTDLCQEPIEVIGASRTDAGVHAYGNVGRNVARIAKGFGMECYAFDSYIPKEAIENFQFILQPPKTTTINTKSELINQFQSVSEFLVQLL